MHRRPLDEFDLTHTGPPNERRNYRERKIYTMTANQTLTGRLTYSNTEKNVTIDGRLIHFHQAGTEHERTVVFLHGGGLGASGWFNFHRNIEPFSEKFHVLLVDMPNYGTSDSVVIQDKDVPRFDADVLSKLLDHLGISRASIVGNSKGGMDAIAFSVHHNDKLDALVLMGSHTGPSIFDPMPATGTTLLFDLFQHPTREKMAQMLRLFFFDQANVDDAFIDLRWDSAMDADKRGHRRAILDSRPVHVNYTARLPEVPNPVLVLHGAHDRFAALDSSTSLMRHYPNSELHVFRNCGHWVQYELADEFNQLTMQWLHSHTV